MSRLEKAIIWGSAITLVVELLIGLYLFGIMGSYADDIRDVNLQVESVLQAIEQPTETVDSTARTTAFDNGASIKGLEENLAIFQQAVLEWSRLISRELEVHHVE